MSDMCDKIIKKLKEGKNMNITENKKFGLTNNQLKIIAAIFMVCDHVGLVLFPSASVLRALGRISFPIYAYLIAEGCRYTRSRARYLGLIAAMGFVFQIFYFVFMDDLYQGILITFSLSITLIFSIEALIKRKNIKQIILALLGIVLSLFIGFACPELFGKYGFAIDYNIWGITLPVIMYFIPSKKARVIFLAISFAVMAYCSYPLQYYALLSVPLIALYNGERGKKKMKYFFYIFYPLHLVLIYAIAIIIELLKQL